MTVFCLGSINADHVYRLTALPRPGETLSARSHAVGLGGKGVNQSVAAHRAGARVVHVGAVGRGDAWVRGQIAATGLSLDHVVDSDAGTGHAIVAVDDGGENQIIIFSGANLDQSLVAIESALSGAQPGDILLLQNETSHQVEAARLARARGLRVFYSAAPFDVDAVRAVLPHATHLLMNAGEAQALTAALGVPPGDLPVEAVVVTHGARGAEWIVPGADPLFVAAFSAKAVDTTGAGDCFAGSLAAALDQGMAVPRAMAFAAAAAAIQVTRPGAAPAMPQHDEIIALLDGR